MIEFTKAHAYGNDFLLAPQESVTDADLGALARAMCDRHAGVGADGLIVYRRTPTGARMTLFNADGSAAEVSGNGVRCLAALVLKDPGAVPAESAPSAEVVIETDAGEKRLTLLGLLDGRYTFRAFMGAPSDVRQLDLDLPCGRTCVVALSVGNPQCVVLGEVSEERLHRLGPLLTGHPAFPQGTNVEFASVERPDRVRILIWERGVGPTMASGTGACAAAVAAMAYGDAARRLDVISPGGTQRVEWCDEGLYLTGWAELICAGRWLRW
ncbi:MAG: diaminopimelate epimerase [Acidobacteria bacterium]|nr:diaminopimelate epimerase [Acidobacteriota bacterium]